MNRRLTDTQRQQYFDDGLVFPVQVLSDDEVRRFRAASDELEDRLGGKPRTVDVRQMHLHFPWAYELATHPRVLDAVEDLLGPNLLVWATELFTKHPWDDQVSIGWHQDRPYMGFQGGATTSAWIALADSTAANGCMRAVPGPARYQTKTNRGDDSLARRGSPDPAETTDRQISSTAPARPPRDSQPLRQKRRVTAVDYSEEETVDILLRAGQMSLHDIDIVHGSGPNRSDKKRIGFVVRYITPEARPLEGHPPAVLARGHDDRGYYQLVGPPAETDAQEALARMRASAAEHLEAMLQNLKAAGTGHHR